MRFLVLGFLLLFGHAFLRGADQTIAARLAPHIQALEAVTKVSEIVHSVTAQNRSRPQDYYVMSEASWASLSGDHPHVLAFMKNPVGEQLRKIQSELISEAFVNDAEGFKVGFLKKTTFWSHKGKAKHEEPMKGKVWIGPVEFEESSGAKQVQVGIPIWSEGKVVGSLVVGFNVFQLAAAE